MKKGIKLAIAAVSALGLCWFAGQQMKQARQETGMPVEQERELSADSGTGTSEQQEWSLRDHVDGAQIMGLVESEDYPYGYNVGAIEDEAVGRAVLLTPGTAIAWEGVISGEAVLELTYGIHPWVAEESDGAVLNIDISADSGVRNYVYNVETAFQEESLPLKDFAGEEVLVEVSVSNQEGKDDSCDWVVLSRFAFGAGSFAESAGGEAPEPADSAYARSATYFGEEWPLNFWNSEFSFLERDMEQIRNDGFDSIILVIPWREFQPQTEPASYNEYAFRKLDQVMEAAGRAGLGVYARVGYLWDYHGDGEEDIRERFFRLMGGGAEREAWHEYLTRIYSALSAHENFREGFLTWEDFWYSLEVCDEPEENGWLWGYGRDIKEIRQEMAAFTGYRKWVKENYALEGYNQNYGTAYTKYEEIPIPGRTEPAMAAMYGFFDSFLCSLLEASQKSFPNLSMEVRMDWDIVRGPGEEVSYYRHNSTYSCQESSFTAVMYGIPMGFENVGERVGFREAIEKTDYILGQLKQENGGKPVFIDQFIFADNTPLYSGNAQIKEEELGAYLENVHRVLLEHSEGYGIWAYRNYRTNMLYNPQFALEEEGWNIAGNVSFEETGGSKVCRLAEESSIGQAVPDVRNHFDDEEYILELDIVEVEKAGELRAAVGDEEKTVDAVEEGRIRLTFSRGSFFDVKIESGNCIASIDNIRLYPYVHEGYLYSEDNQPLLCLDAIRKLNGSLAGSGR